MSAASQFFGGGSPIKSIQRGTISIAAGSLTNSATISSVDTTKTFLSNLGADYDGTAPGSTWRFYLANSTTVSALRRSPLDEALVISYEVIEYN